MIKTKKCSECDKPAFSKGLCKFHQPKKNIKRVRQLTVEKKKEVQEKRNTYFNYHLSRCSHSDESGLPIPNPTRANICHIFDKSRHPSLEDNLDNCVYLTFEEHQDFDRLLYSHEFKKLEEKFKNSFEKACEIGKGLISLCQENTVFTREFKKYLDGKYTKS